MPIHNPGYREWNPRLVSASTRWTVIARIGIVRAWQSAWLRRVVFFAWIPAAAMGFMIFMYERAAEEGGGSERFVQSIVTQVLMNSTPGRRFENIVLPNSGFLDNRSLAANRRQFWSMLLLNLFQRSQAFLLIPMVGLIAPPLISQDFRSRAFLLYFSRPLSRGQYILGKAATLLTYILLVTLLPGLLLYTVGILLSPDLSIVMYTWDIPLRVVAVSVMIGIPSTLLALMFSSMTTESRNASFAWFSVWIFGFAAHSAMTLHPGMTADTGVVIQSLSLFHLFRDIGGWILDVRTGISDIETRLAFLGVITAVSLAVLIRRVSAPMQV